LSPPQQKRTREEGCRGGLGCASLNLSKMYATALLTTIFGTLYPAYMSFNAIKGSDKEEDIQVSASRLSSCTRGCGQNATADHLTDANPPSCSGLPTGLSTPCSTRSSSFSTSSSPGECRRHHVGISSFRAPRREQEDGHGRLCGANSNFMHSRDIGTDCFGLMGCQGLQRRSAWIHGMMNVVDRGPDAVDWISAKAVPWNREHTHTHTHTHTYIHTYIYTHTPSCILLLPGIYVHHCKYWR
jgi:hypothetical protein